MKLHELAPAPGSRRRSKRLGRGHGSGRVKTAGKGTKGQNSRAGAGGRPFFEGGQNPWTMRIPHKRGFSNRRFHIESQIVNLRDLERLFAAGDEITVEVLKQKGLVDDASRKRPVKILGEGTLSKALTLRVHRASASARAAIERAGGSLMLLEHGPDAEAGEADAAGGGAPADVGAPTAPGTEA